MKRLILLLAIGFTTINAFAVTHANTWTIYSYFVDAMNPEENSGYFTTVTAGQDTIIDGKTYFQAAGFLFRYNEDSTRIYCRVTEDDLQNNESFDIGKYFTSKCIKDNEILCYAYDVQANDTLNILRYGTDAWATIYVIDSVKTMDGRRYVYNHYLDGDLPHSDEESEIMAQINKDIDNDIASLIKGLKSGLEQCAKYKKMVDNCFVAEKDTDFTIYSLNKRVEPYPNIKEKFDKAFSVSKRTATYKYNYVRRTLFRGFKDHYIKIKNEVPDITLELPVKLYASKLFDELPKIDSNCCFEVFLKVEAFITKYRLTDDFKIPGRFEKDWCDILVPFNKDIEKITFEEMFNSIKVSVNDELGLCTAPQSIEKFMCDRFGFVVKAKIPM